MDGLVRGELDVKNGLEAFGAFVSASPDGAVDPPTCGRVHTARRAVATSRSETPSCLVRVTRFPLQPFNALTFLPLRDPDRLDVCELADPVRAKLATKPGTFYPTKW